MALKKRLRGMTKQERVTTAVKAGVSDEFLRLVSRGWKKASIETAEKLEAIVGVPGAEEIVSASNKKILSRIRANGSP